MADELWIVSDAEHAGWTIDSEGKTVTDKEYPLDGQRVAIAVPDAPLTEKQAKAIRKLIAKLRTDGVLAGYPKVGVQYPQKTTVDNVKQSMPYLHCWHDDCDEEAHSGADLGVSEGLPWVTPEAVEPPDQSVHEDTLAQHSSLTAARDERKAAEPAAGVPEESQSGGLVEGGEEVLSVGMEGTNVEAWQAVCNEVLAQDVNSEEELLVADGVFGPDTKKVTEAVQSILGVPATGVVDNDTWVAVI